MSGSRRFRYGSLIRLATLDLLLILLFTPSAFAQDSIGPESVWDPHDHPSAGLENRAYGDVDCVTEVMQAAGASTQAVAFVELLGGEGILIEFEEMGVVDLGTVFYPGRANDNWQPVLLNGVPGLIHVDRTVEVDIRTDPLYPALVSRNPGLLLWSGDNHLERIEPLLSGGRRFVFGFLLVNGCHACEVAGYAWVGFDFDNSGIFLGTELLSLVAADHGVSQIPAPPGPLGQSLIAYTGPDGNIRIIREDGADPRQISYSGQDCCPVWFPDGTRLYYVRDKGETGEIVAYDFMSQNETTVEPPVPGVGSSIALSPDGRKLSFIYNETLSPPPGEFLLIDNKACLAILDLDTGTHRDLACEEQAFMDDPSFSPDGISIVVTLSGFEWASVFAYPIDGSGPTVVACCWAAGYFPDGNSLVTIASAYYLRDLFTGQDALGILKTDLLANTFTLLMTSSEPLDSPEIHPEGERLVYEHNGLLEVRDLTTGETVYVIDGAWPTWHPTGAAVPASSEMELAERFLPLLHFHPQETYRHAISVDPVLAQAELKRGDQGLPGPLKAQDLLDGSWNAPDSFIDFPGEGRSDLARKYQELVCPSTEACSPTVYARVERQPTTGEIALQYWLFYYGNPFWSNYHEGDWEMIQVVLSATEKPQYAAYSQHDWCSRRYWPDVRKGSNDRPNVYVGWGSHASFFRPGGHLSDWAGDVPLWEEPKISLIPENQAWVDFRGHWGARGLLDGPPGPVFQNGAKWNDPFTWGQCQWWDEDAPHNAVDNLRISVTAPLDVSVEVDSELPQGNAGRVEYFDNAFTGRRTTIIYSVEAGEWFEAHIGFRPTEEHIRSPATGTPLSATLNFADVEAGQTITATYALADSWKTSSVGTILAHSGSDFILQVDLDGDGGIDQQVVPVSLEETPADFTPPVAVDDLSAVASGADSVHLSWTAPSDGGAGGTVMAYEVRYADSPSNESRWLSVTGLDQVPTPLTAGMGESLDVTGLEPGLYYFAIRSMDDGFHVSELSNVAEVRLPPELAPVATVTEPTPEVSSAPESAKQVLEEESVSQEISPVPSPGDSNDVNKPEVWLVVAPSALVGFILVAVILALLRRRRIRAAAVTENRFCIYCGVEYPPFGRYCIKCGRERE